jgi:hypothetical protein
MDKGPRRNLVFSSVGDASVHRRWIKDGPRNFDLFLCYYGSAGYDYRRDAEFFLERPGTKFENFCHVYRNFNNQVTAYENLFIVDDDIILDTPSLNRMFDLFDAHGLWLAQPAYSNESHIRWPTTRQDPSALLRFTNFIEVGVILIRRLALYRIIETMEQSRSGWGLDMLFSQLLDDPLDKIAILDTAPCLHPFRDASEMDRVMSREAQKAEGLRLLDQYRGGQWIKPVIYRTILRPGDSHREEVRM